MKYPYRSKRWLHWHGRTGHPVIHKSKTTGKTYVMVRAKGGKGTRRLYDYQKHLRDEPAKHYRNGKRKKLKKYQR